MVSQDIELHHGTENRPKKPNKHYSYFKHLQVPIKGKVIFTSFIYLFISDKHLLLSPLLHLISDSNNPIENQIFT